MAKMIPDAYPTDTSSTAERTLFCALESGLDHEFTVIHSLPWLDEAQRFLQQGECDFAVCHPAYGLLAIETKAGEAQYDAANATWYRPDGSRLNKDPFKQAQSTVHHLNRLLVRDVSGWSQAAPPFGYAVAFPHADRMLGRFPPHVRPEIVILESDLAHLQSKIVEILTRFRSPQTRMTKKLYDRALERLLPEFQVVRTLKAQLRSHKEGLLRMTEEQIRLLEAMRSNHRLLVQGCAGSGKTLLAFEKASRLAEAGSRVLLLCFNIPLANWLRTQAEQQSPSGRIDVFHFHGLCEHVVRAIGREFQVPESNVSEFWDVKCADLLQESLPGYAERYDAIIVDEGQDFIEYWWIPIESLLADPASGCFYIFHDPQQNIFQRDNGFPFPGPTMQLDMNCRNTSEIASYVHQLVGSNSQPARFNMAGLAPVHHVVRTEAEELSEVSAILQQLLNVDQLTPDQIVIIGCHRFENSPYAQASPLGGVTIVSETDAAADSSAIRYATIYRFKGLEADCAILTGFSRSQDDRRVRELYVAASRARTLLHLLFRE